ncbi:MAG: lysine--tRNA ligase [Kiritimatiellae bacterium]|nr:lysine--tRNA ligase [Kiritimatiellia bacterium]
MKTEPTPPAEPESSEYREMRLANLRALEALGWKPHGGAFERDGELAEIRARFSEGAEFRAAGRIVAKRDMGKAVFAHLQDSTAKLQIYLRRDDMPEEQFQAFKHADLGDVVGVRGACFTTRTGEPTLHLSSWTPLAKALQTLPEKWHGLKDVEQRYRQRYLDLIANPETAARFRRRIAIVREIRAFLHDRGFCEVETPMLQPQPGGAAARPFETFFHALNHKMFLRIAPELYLKRLLVGGMNRVFELNRNFRNEGLDRSHNPEFTMLELYEAYGDVRTMKRLIEDMVLHLADTVIGSRLVGSPERPVDLSPPWRTATYDELIREYAGDGWPALDAAAAAARAAELGAPCDPGWTKAQITHEVYEKVVEKSLRNPTFVTRMPADLIPLARRCDDDPERVDVFELVMDGKEIAPAYSELNDALEQRRRFEEQAGDDGQKVDEDFLLAMEHGMPPAGGMGVGIDRLAMVLTGAESIRDIILFPQLKVRGDDPAGSEAD